jgi:hypothetical protein
VTEQLEVALTALAEAEAEAAARPSQATAERRRQALARAGERLWCLVVQREAMGLTRHQVLDEVLKIPPAVHAVMGPGPRPPGPRGSR